MKTFPYFLVATFASFVVTYGFFAATSDDKGIQHWVAQQTSALAAITRLHG